MGFGTFPRSPRRPAHRPPANNVAMQVRHRFTCVGTVIEHQSKAGFSQPQVPRHFRRLQQQVPQNLVVFWFGLSNARDGLFGNHQNVRWGLGFYVTKCQHQIVFKNDRGRDLARDDFFEKCLAHGPGTCGPKPRTSNETQPVFSRLEGNSHSGQATLLSC